MSLNIKLTINIPSIINYNFYILKVYSIFNLYNVQNKCFSCKKSFHHQTNITFNILSVDIKINL